MVTREEWVKKNEGFLSGLLPGFRDKVLELFDLAKSKGMSFNLTSGYRSQAKQDELRATGKGVTAGVIPAKDSYHTYGAAIDFKPVVGSYAEIGYLGKQLGLRYGGDFKTPDKVHLDWGTVYTKDQLKTGIAGKAGGATTPGKRHPSRK